LSVARAFEKIFNKNKYLRRELASLLWAVQSVVAALPDTVTRVGWVKPITKVAAFVMGFTHPTCVPIFAVVALLVAQNVFAALPDTVKFPSRDGKSELTGYVFKPAAPGPHPAVVMLHGRGGPYSSLKPGVADASNLTARHRMWGEFWAGRGYLALHVDSFGARGYPQGFPKHSYNARPAAVNEQTVRPLDAYGALDYLRTRRDVIADRIGVQGWSNGAMTLLAAMAPNPPRIAADKADRVRLAAPAPHSEFRAAIAQYPGCRIQHEQSDYKPYAPLLMLTASDDDEVSPQVCETLAQQIKARGADIEFVIYAGAHHSYDDPGRTKQSHAPNKAAMEDSLRRAQAFFAKHLRAQP
jgi:carboxymethylenebutenolidase